MKFHPLVLFFAAVGAVVMAYTASEVVGSDDGGCCSGNKWQSHTASFKFNVLFEKIMDNLKQGNWPNAILLGTLFIESMDPTFDMIRDDLPFDRSKLIHSVGNIVNINWVPNNASVSKYTGIFRSGSKYGFLRASTAAEANPKQTTCDPQCPFVPGISIKLMRDSVASANIFAMYSLEGQTSFNFFKNNLTNHPALDCDDLHGSLKLLFDKFRTASDWPTTLGLSALARHDESGVEYKPPTFPYQLLFVPAPALTTAFPDTPPSWWTDLTLATQLQEIPSGTDLYTILALETPQSAWEQIGVIRTTSTFTTSKWNDKNMFFQHTRIEDDLEFYPEWKSSLPEC